MTVTGLTTTNANAKLTVGGNLTIDAAINLGSGDLFLDVDGFVTQTASITADRLGLMVDGITTLKNAANDVNVIAADNQNNLLFVDQDDLIVGSVTVDGMMVDGITTSNDSVKLTAGGNLMINSAISTGNLMLVSGGDVSQTAAITSVRLGLMVDGTSTLQDPTNDVAIFAANNGGTTLYTDANNLQVSSITVDGMTITGITTSDDDVKLTTVSNLGIQQAIDVGTGNLFLNVAAGAVTQTATGTIEASGLGLMVSGSSVLQNPGNDVDVLASQGGPVLFTDLDGLAIGSVTVDGMTVTGLTTTNENAKLAIGGNLTIDATINLGSGDLFLDVDGFVTQTASITADRLGLMVDGITTLKNAANDVNVIAADNQSNLLFVDQDDLIVGSVTVDGMMVDGITTSNDSVKLTAGGNLTINSAISTGNLMLVSGGDVSQTAAITSVRLGLMVDGSTTLQDPTNDVAILAANNGGTTLYTDANNLQVSSITVDGMTITGITTSDDDVKLTTVSNLGIQQAIDVGTGNLFLNVAAGAVTQTATGTIEASGLGLMVSGSSVLQNPGNDVDVLASQGGPVLFTDLDGLAIGSVTVDGMTVTGLTTTNANAKLAVGGNLTIDAAINLGSGDLFLDVDGFVTQTASITADRLGLMVDGITTLKNAANDVNVIAADNQSNLLFVDQDDLIVGSVTVDGMMVDGITTSNDSVKLTAGGNLTINSAISTGNLMLVSGGDVSQTAAITSVRLGLMVDGSTTLQDPTNDVAILAANNGGTTLYTDANNLQVSSITVDGMTITGITTSDDDVKLTTVSNLGIQQAIDVGTGNLFLNVAAGAVTQTATGTIEASGLGLMVSGSSVLQNPGNDVDVLASQGGPVLFTDLDGLAIGSVTVDGMTVTGLTTTNANAKLAVGGNLTIDAAINLGSGDLFLDVDGFVTQTASITADRLGLMVDGITTLKNPANDVNVIGADNQSNLLFVDQDDLIVGSVTVDGMMVDGITTSNDSVKLTAGSNLTINSAISTGNLMLVSGGDVSQMAAITSVRLGLMVDGTSTLQDPTNDVAILAANNGGTTLYTDANNLQVSSITVDGMTITGITTSNDDVKLTTVSNLGIQQAIDVGTGNLFLSVAAGAVTQTATGTIEASGLGLMVSGSSVLQNPGNDVDVLASQGGPVLFTDLDGLAIGSVTFDGMTVTGLTTTNANAKLTVGGNLTIDAAVNLGSGDLFLDVDGFVTQTASITADRLGLMVDGITTLKNAANDVNVIGADNQSNLLFVDQDDLIVGSVTVDGMMVDGITTSNDDVKLVVGDTAGENLSIAQAIGLGTGDLFLDVAGSVTQATPGTITAAGLGLMVDGNTRLQLGNDVNTLAANTGGTVLFNDVDGLTIGTVTVLDGTADQMQLAGITSSNDDVKLIVAGDLTIQQAVGLGTGDLFLDVAGNVTQAAPVRLRRPGWA